MKKRHKKDISLTGSYDPTARARIINIRRFHKPLFLGPQNRNPEVSLTHVGDLKKTLNFLIAVGTPS